MDTGFNIRVTADASNAIQNVKTLTDQLKDQEKEWQLLDLAIQHAYDRGADTTEMEASLAKVSAKLAELRNKVANQSLTPPVIPPIVVPDERPLLDSIGKQRIAFLDLGRIITGQGFNLRSLASNFTLLGPGVTIAVAALYGLYEVLSKQTDAEKKADEQAKQLKETLLNLKSATDVTAEALGSEQGNIDRVRALAAAVQDSNKTYAERKTALDLLRETNKAYFGDLTLEASSLATLNDRVDKYSQALITQAIVKGQVDAISKLSSTLEDQILVYNKLKSAKEQADDELARAPKTTSFGNTVAGGAIGDVNNVAKRESDKATEAFNAQRDAVFKLREQIATYRGELNNAINDELKQKPLTDAPKAKDDLKSIIPILKEIEGIYNELAKPLKNPLFEREKLSIDPNEIKLLQTQIQEAFVKANTEGAKDPRIQQAYKDLGKALQAKLSATQNPDLKSHIQPIADIDDKELAEFAKNSGKKLTDYMHHLPPMKTDIKVEILFDDFTQYQQNFKKKLDKLRTDATENLRDFTKDMQDQAAIALGKGLGEGNLKNAFDGFVSYLGSSIEKLGEQLIVASALFSAIDVSLSSLFDNPLLAAAVGVAAVAVGAAMKKSFKATPFAEGGIITAPTYALMGEAGPEAVMPLNKIGSFMNGFQARSQSVNISGDFRIAGNDLVLTMARAQKNRNLVQ